VKSDERATVERRGPRLRWWAVGAAGLLLALGAPASPGAADAAPTVAEKKDSCIACHGDPSFLVTNKKLYDYFRQWQASVHRQEGVTCDECHGGRPDAPDKETAHDGGVGASDPQSGVYYKNVVDTCGSCHDDILEGFLTSNHYEHLEKKDEKQGPTCVTCHGSINVEILNVNSVEAACARCHNDETENHPELPAKARDVLNRFLSIHRFYRYVSVHAGPEEAKAFFARFDPRMEALSVTWHTFDLDKIDAGTAEVLRMVKEERDRLRQRRENPTPPAPDAKP